MLDVQRRICACCLIAIAAAFPLSVAAEAAQQLIELRTRPAVTQRFVYLAAAEPKAAVVLFSGGQGNLQLADDGRIQSSDRNFLVRARRLFVDNGLAVAVVDAPSDRQASPFLGGFRQTPEHVADIKAVIGWLRQRTRVPVWLVGTSRGTQSAAFVATELRDRKEGPDGLVLTSTILIDKTGRPVPAMPLQILEIPVLVVHHDQDGCRSCPYSEIPGLISKLGNDAANRELITITGGEDHGDPCQPLAHHGFNGQDVFVVSRIAAWIVAH